MTEKIEWYKEVLELEPNSKVFFPLARMLANEGATEEAIDIIEKGLVRHPEFLEARLYCIELLHKCGRVEACQAHVERLSKMLSAYGEFWRAWASCIAAMKESGSEDTAAALRFLAANFLHGPISLNKIIEEGLAAVLGEKRPGEAAQAAMVAPAPAVAPEAVAASATAAPETAAAAAAAGLAAGAAMAAADELPIEEEPAPQAASLDDDLPGMADAAPVADELPLVEEPAPQAAPLDDDLLGMTDAAPVADELPVVEEPAPQAASLDDDLLGMTDAAPVADELPVVEEPAPQAASLDDDLLAMTDAAPDDDSSVMDEADALLTDESFFTEDAASADGDDDNMFADLDETLEAEDLPDLDAAPMMMDAEPAASAPTEAAAMPDEEQDTPDAEETPQETFSIRTRSMAEVLAEQGDIQGALEIYQELAQTAEGAEKDELSQRIITLQARLGGAVPTPAVEEAPAKAPTGKEQVLSVLTSLAKGLENRAH